jgi:hypothetical protein
VTYRTILSISLVLTLASGWLVAAGTPADRQGKRAMVGICGAVSSDSSETEATLEPTASTEKCKSPTDVCKSETADKNKNCGTQNQCKCDKPPLQSFDCYEKR